MVGRQNEKTGGRLLCMLSPQANFGAAVGTPVLFYLGPFVYTVLGPHNVLSDQDATISLAFGVEWMIPVHVAMLVAAC